MARNILALLPQLLLTSSAFGVLLVDGVSREEEGRAACTCAVALTSTMVVAVSLMLLPYGVRQREFWGGMWLLDPFSLFFQVLLAVGLILVLLESAEFVRAHRLPGGPFYALLLLATVGMSIMASSRELLTIFVALELMSVSLCALVETLGQDPRSQEAATQVFLDGASSFAVLLFGSHWCTGWQAPPTWRWPGDWGLLLWDGRAWLLYWSGVV
ncbi:MAG TPA: hypothetical protein GXX55_11920 [Firmicutes bacterium]|nr:hypothetical protein [Bacillota bacterium]